MMTKRKTRALWSMALLFVSAPLYAHVLKAADTGFLGGLVPHFHAMDYLLLLMIVAVAVIWGWLRKGVGNK